MGRLLSSFGKKNTLWTPIEGEIADLFSASFILSRLSARTMHKRYRPLFIYGECKWLKNTNLGKKESHCENFSDCPLQDSVKDLPGTSKKLDYFLPPSLHGTEAGGMPILDFGCSPSQFAGGSSTALCSWAGHFTLIVPLSTHVYKWVPANLLLAVTLQWTSIPSRGE